MIEDLVLNGRYRLGTCLAAGGMGEVWRATDEVLARPVAVKLLRQEYVSDEAARTRFRAEARYAAALQHSGIAQVYDYGEQDDRAFLVMELVQGEPLSKILARTGRLNSESTLDLVSQTARALHVAHSAGIVHRDVKPANLMITSDGTVKITDFGIARGAAASTLTQTGMVMGTAHYLAPEQASGQQITGATDLYALGIVAYECLAGRPPFDAEAPVAIALMHVRETPPELPPEVSLPVRELVGSMLAKTPAGRPAGALRLADQAYVIRESIVLGMASAQPAELETGELADTLAAEEVPGRRRSALLLTSVAAGAVLVGAIGVASLWRGPANADLVNGDKGPVTQVPGQARPDRAAPQGPNEPGASRPVPVPRIHQAPINKPTTSTTSTPKASPSGRPSATPTKSDSRSPHTTPTPTESPTSPSPSSPVPSSPDLGGLGSENKV